MPPARIACKVGLPGRSYPYGEALSAGTREFQLAHGLGVTTHKGLAQASMPRQRPPWRASRATATLRIPAS